MLLNPHQDVSDDRIYPQSAGTDVSTDNVKSTSPQRVSHVERKYGRKQRKAQNNNIKFASNLLQDSRIYQDEKCERSEDVNITSFIMSFDGCTQARRWKVKIH